LTALASIDNFGVLETVLLLSLFTHIWSSTRDCYLKMLGCLIFVSNSPTLGFWMIYQSQSGPALGAEMGSLNSGCSCLSTTWGKVSPCHPDSTFLGEQSEARPPIWNWTWSGL
jgi:hypothetical protein